MLEKVRSGEPLAAAAQGAAARARRLAGLAHVAKAAKGTVEFEWLGVDRATVTDVLDLKTRPRSLIGAERPVTYETVSRAAPRFFYRQDPVVCLEGLERSLRHGHDGIHTASGALACRLSGDEVTALSGVVDGAELLGARLEHGGIPPEVEDLLAEAALTDHTATDEISRLAAERRGLPAEAVRARVDAEARLRLRAMAPGSDAARLYALSLADGVLPSPVALTPFRQAWVPLYLEWQLELEIDDRLDRWTLGELDYEPGPEGAPGAETVTVDGRSLLTASATKSFADQVATFLAEEDRLDKAGQGILRARRPEAAARDRRARGEARHARRGLRRPARAAARSRGRRGPRPRHATRAVEASAPAPRRHRSRGEAARGRRLRPRDGDPCAAARRASS